MDEETAKVPYKRVGHEWCSAGSQYPWAMHWPLQERYKKVYRDWYAQWGQGSQDPSAEMKQFGLRGFIDPDYSAQRTSQLYCQYEDEETDIEELYIEPSLGNPKSASVRLRILDYVPENWDESLTLPELSELDLYNPPRDANGYRWKKHLEALLSEDPSLATRTQDLPVHAMRIAHATWPQCPDNESAGQAAGPGRQSDA